MGKYPLLKNPYCRKCSVEKYVTENCPWHKGFSDNLKRIYTIGPYYPRKYTKSSLLDKHIIDLKNDSSLAIPIALAMSLMIISKYKTELKKFDLLVPIPLHKNDMISRGYNQTEELTEIISKECNMPQSTLLKKIREFKQRGKDMDERWRQVKGAYSCDFNCDGKSIIIIDDVSTSGATLSECADVLSQHGAEKICALVGSRNSDRKA